MNLGADSPPHRAGGHTRASEMSPCCGFFRPHLTHPQRHLGLIKVLLGTSHPLCSGLHLTKPSALMHALA